MSEGLTETELTCLRWCVSCNSSGIGFLYPTAWRSGPLAAYGAIVERGLVTFVDCRARGLPRKEGGYWITHDGDEALKRHDGAPR